MDDCDFYRLDKTRASASHEAIMSHAYRGLVIARVYWRYLLYSKVNQISSESGNEGRVLVATFMIGPHWAKVMDER
jgi:hypothetical protein